jgi:hypothetical protein
MNENIDVQLKDIMDKIKNVDYTNGKMTDEKKERIANLLKIHSELIGQPVGINDTNDVNNNKPKSKRGRKKKIIAEPALVEPIKKNQPQELVFDQINYNGNKYYLNGNSIWNEHAELVGSLMGYDNEMKPIISFFDTKINKYDPKNIKKYQIPLNKYDHDT